MKNIYQILLLFFIIAFSHSCQKEIEFDSKQIAPKMVINGFIQQDSLIAITIAASKAIVGVIKPTVWINDATVKLFVDGEEKETLSTFNIPDYTINYFDPSSYQPFGDSTNIIKCYRSLTTKAEPGKMYKLEVTHSNYKTTTCETSIPMPINILSIDTITKTEVTNGYTTNTFQLKIKFQDPPGEKNYYRLIYKSICGRAITKNNTQNDSSIVIAVNNLNVARYFTSDDPVINPSSEDANDFLFGSPSNNFNIFTDELIEGKEHELTIDDYSYVYESSNINTSIGEFFTLSVELQSITPEAYSYLKSVNASTYYNGDLFSEPVQVFTNIENGIGVFAGFSVRSKSISKGNYPIEGIEYQIQNNGYISNLK